MKKIAIIATILLTTGLTALSVSRKENKIAEVKTEKADFANKITPFATGARLATAD